MVSLHRVGGVNDAPDGIGKLKIGRKFMPVIAPRFYHDGIVFAPFEFEIIQLVFRFFQTDGLINLLEVFNELFLIFACHVFDRIAYLVYNTALNNGFGKNT